MKNLALLVLFIHGLMYGSTYNISKQMDLLIADLNQQLKASGGNAVHLRSMHVHYNIRSKSIFLPFISISGHFACSNGHMKSMDTLQRAGEFVAHRLGSRIFVKGKLRFADLGFYYNDCYMKVLKIKTKVPFNASVSSNKFKFSAVIHRGEHTCKTITNTFKKLWLGEIHLSSLHFPKKTIMHFFKGSIRRSFLRKFKYVLNKKFRNLDLCKYLNLTRIDTFSEGNSTLNYFQPDL